MMKSRFNVLLAAVLVIAVLLTGCGGTPAETDGGEGVPETITVTDHSGSTVTLPAHIERIAVANIYPLPSVLAVFFDSADKIVAMAPSSMTAAKNGLLSELYPEILNADTTAISGADVNTEELMKLDPQVVFYSAENPTEGETLKKAGFNAVAVSANKWSYNALETLDQWIALLSQIFPDVAGDRAERVRRYGDEMFEFVLSRTQNLPAEERKRVFFLFQYSEDAIVTSGQRFFGQWWSYAAGAVNAAAEMQGENGVKVTLEQVYAWDPDLILMTNFTPSTPEDLYTNAVGSYDWSGLTAVQNRQVYKMPLGLYRSYTTGADAPVTLLWLAKTIYPELFSDIDITEKVMEYYDTVFDVELTPAQAERIFAPARDAGKIELK